MAEAHLACLTQYSRTGERKMTGTMHPNGRDITSTAEPSKRTKGIRAKRSKWLDIRIREWSNLKPTDQEAHRKPGSMK